MKNLNNNEIMLISGGNCDCYCYGEITDSESDGFRAGFVEAPKKKMIQSEIPAGKAKSSRECLYLCSEIYDAPISRCV